MGKRNLIRFDWAIKRLLRNKANFEVLEGFLSVLLKEDLKIEDILESESNQQTVDDKYNRVDILVKNQKGELVIVEIQNQNELDYFQRMNYGTAKAVSEHISIGEEYVNVKKVYSVNIVYFDLGQGEDYVYYGKTDFRGIHKEDKLFLSDKQKEAFQKIEPSQLFPEYYLIKVNSFDDIAKDSLDEWIYYLKNDEIKDNFKAKGIAKAKELLVADKLSDEEYRQYDRYLENLRYKASMLLSMKFDAEWELRADIAREMKKNGVAIDIIVKSTRLPKGEIEKL